MPKFNSPLTVIELFDHSTPLLIWQARTIFFACSQCLLPPYYDTLWDVSITVLHRDSPSDIFSTLHLLRTILIVVYSFLHLALRLTKSFELLSGSRARLCSRNEEKKHPRTWKAHWKRPLLPTLGAGVYGLYTSSKELVKYLALSKVKGPIVVRSTRKNR